MGFLFYLVLYNYRHLRKITLSRENLWPTLANTAYAFATGGFHWSSLGHTFNPEPESWIIIREVKSGSGGGVNGRRGKAPTVNWGGGAPRTPESKKCFLPRSGLAFESFVLSIATVTSQMFPGRLQPEQWASLPVPFFGGKCSSGAFSIMFLVRTDGSKAHHHQELRGPKAMAPFPSPSQCWAVRSHLWSRQTTDHETPRGGLS